jgi:4a-hydroxytetrahydrobiopterin dehydratase
MAELLDDGEIEAGLQALEGWRREGDEIVCDLELRDFVAALAFVNAVGTAAEAANHHPDILLHAYRRVSLRLSTHSAGGLTSADLDLAAAIDRLAADA